VTWNRCARWSLRMSLAAMLLFAGAVHAQSDNTPPPDTARPRRVIRVEETRVEGRIQKPQAFYILQRSQLNFGELNKSESFVDKIERSVEKEAF
jgi:hypothetical protein